MIIDNIRRKDLPKYSFVVMLFLFSFRLMAQKTVVAAPLYSLSWDGNSTLMKIDVDYESAAATTRFVFAKDIGNDKTIFRAISNITVDNGERFTIDSTRRSLTVKNSTNHPHHLHYEVNGHLVIEKKNAALHELFRPIIEPGNLRVKAMNLLMRPDSNAAKEIVLKWAGKPRPMPYLASLAPEATIDSVIAVPDDNFSNLLMLMGDDLSIKKHTVHGNPYYQVTSGRDTINNMPAVQQPFFDTFFPRSYDFWNDKKAGTYFLCSVPFYTPEQTVNTGYAVGKYGFVMVYQGKYGLNNTMIVAHETSHKWIGGELTIKDAGERYTWFSEGVNDYITYFLLAGCGMISKNDFVAEANKSRFNALYQNPVNTIHADSLARHFWDSYNDIQISYQRGFVYGFVLDNEIRLTSGGKKTIRDFLVALLQKRRAKGTELTFEDFIQCGKHFVPEYKLISEIQQHMIQGELFDFTKIRLVSGLHVLYKEGIPSLTIDTNIDLKRLYTINHFND